VVEPPTFKFDKLAHNTLEHMDPEWSRRNGENVMEIKTRVVDVVVAHEYHWWVPTFLCESLEDELKRTKTKVPPSNVEIPPTARWKYGCDEDEAMPTNRTEELKKQLRIRWQEQVAYITRMGRK
jgi:hypothetical protein